MTDDLYVADMGVGPEPGGAGSSGPGAVDPVGPADPVGPTDPVGPAEPAGADAGAGPPSEESRRSLDRAFERAEFAPFGEKPRQGGHSNIDLLLDVPLPITVELGRTNMAIRDILDLGPGSVVELDRVAGEPVDILVNGKLVARGEVVVIDESFGVRVVDIVTPAERLTSAKA